jgi:CheY-like chemotaxis protein
MKILIAEDDKVLAEVLKEEFKDEGFAVTMAENGKEAMNALKSKANRPDLMLLDLLMPVMDGFAVLKEISEDQISNLKDIPVIVLSNLGQDEEIKRAFQLGASDYFVKSQHPVAEVVEKVKTFLEKPKDVSYKEELPSEVKRSSVKESVDETTAEEEEEAPIKKEIVKEKAPEKVRKLKVKLED